MIRIFSRRLKVSGLKWQCMWSISHRPAGAEGKEEGGPPGAPDGSKLRSGKDAFLILLSVALVDYVAVTAGRPFLVETDTSVSF